MSHTAIVAVEIKDKTAFLDACKRLGVQGNLEETVRLFDGSTQTGMTVRLKGWMYPVVFKDGKAFYDNYRGCWGKEAELQKFRQLYATCAAKRQAQRQGFRVQERKLADGRIQLVCSK
jgi:hypothetical protein